MRSLVPLLVAAFVLTGPVRIALLRIRWSALAPRAAIMLWQTVMLSAVASIAGAVVVVVSMPFGGTSRTIDEFSSLLVERPVQVLTPEELFALTAGLIVVTLLVTSVLARTIGVMRARAHHRMLVDLLGEHRSEAPGAFVLEHESATAYCLPGFHPRIVLSSGALRTLGTDELAAVLAHERAHLRAHHHLVLLPYEVLASLSSRSRVLATSRNEVRSLIEMAADDRALRECGRGALARALCRLTADATPTFALGAEGYATFRRVERVLAARTPRRLVLVGAAAASIAVLALPFAAVLAVGGP